MRFFDSLLASTASRPRPPSDTALSGPRVMLRMGMPSDWQAWRDIRGLSRDFLKPWELEWPRDALSRPFFEGMLRRHMREWREGTGYGFFVFLGTETGQMRSPPLTGGDRGGVGSASKPVSYGETTPHQQRNILIGGIGLNDLRRGIAQKATLGYWIGETYAAKGYMTEAAGLVCDFAFHTLKLHRVEASCLPANEPSKKLLARLGFVEEGYAKSYLRIDGAWQDHVLWGRTAQV